MDAALQKDFIIFQKQLVSDIDKGKKELKEIERQKTIAREELSHILSLKEPNVKSLDQKIADKTKELLKLESEISFSEKSLSEQKKSGVSFLDGLKKSIEDRRLLLRGMDEAQEDMEQQMLNLSNAAETYRTTIRKLDEEILGKHKIIEEIKVLSSNKETLKIEISILESKKKELEKREQALADYRQTVEEKEQDLYQAMDEVNLMKERLTPEYRKVFGMYANL